ncbi:DUF4279 domain-containing protein [Xenorhabdus anantnagensis]|uniref:DUF4279 domain-containing protein n=1 Tax=Xenorhabdus anantnagensis TaxID=3025875 RepID=A0ABT5LS71_9GAMM|nr:DUF4279 domain-containing protein [Xenorhabdus anantnagensis]MDC9597251.1 DUF4279 domain-containing protein [Xenorhabdus anantnagensis]
MDKSTVRVYFAVSGEDINPTDITHELSLQPIQSWMKGDLIPETNRRREYSFWSIGTGDEKSLDINEQFNKVFSYLQGKENTLIEMGCQYELEYQFNVVIKVKDEVTPAMHLDNVLLRKVNALNADISIDLYVYS